MRTRITAAALVAAAALSLGAPASFAAAKHHHPTAHAAKRKLTACGVAWGYYNKMRGTAYEDFAAQMVWESCS
jgi:hypothetical protein